jgi:TPR repeat protein
MFPSYRILVSAISFLAALLCLYARAQDQAIPPGVIALEFNTEKDKAPPKGVRITSVMKNGPADQAGLKPGDVLLRLGENEVTADNWYQLMHDFPPGSKMPVEYEREGKTAKGTVLVGGRIETYTQLANAGDPEAMIRLGQTYWGGYSVPVDKQEALRWYRKAGESPDANAGLLEWLGSTYYYGREAPEDVPQAFLWYRRAAEKGNINAMSQLGWMYSHAQGTPLNGQEAVRWLRQAADKNYPPAEYYLGAVLLNGLGVPKDYAQAAVWMRKAADQGVPEAMSDLGYLYDQGFGVPKNPYEANNWYRKAAEKGNPMAEANLASSYYLGTGIAQNFVEAYFWYQLAKANGFTLSRPGLEALPERLSQQQLADGQRRVAAWVNAAIVISTDPPSTSLYLNNQFAGISDATGHLELHDVRSGDYSVRAAAPGYEDFHSTWRLEKHGNYQLPIKLTPASADLKIVTNPASAQVYVNDEFKGTSSAEGVLVIGKLAKGKYHVRVSLAGFNDWARDIELVPGSPSTVEASLQHAGPPPLSLQDVTGLLKGGISRVRAATLVKERGVDFALNDSIEQQIRSAGGDSDLLLVIATSKR